MKDYKELDLVTEGCGELLLFSVYQMKDGSLEFEPWELCRCCLEPPSVIPSKDYKPKTDYDCNKSHY